MLVPLNVCSIWLSNQICQVDNHINVDELIRLEATNLFFFWLIRTKTRFMFKKHLKTSQTLLQVSE